MQSPSVVHIANIIQACRKKSALVLNHRRNGSLLESTKNELVNLEMESCLEYEYMKCIQHSRANNLRASPVDACEPFVEEYIGLGKGVSNATKS